MRVLSVSVRAAALTLRYVNKLVRVMLLTGDESWIYIHIEVQDSQQAVFAKLNYWERFRMHF